jgi:hypothetical protein
VESARRLRWTLTASREHRSPEPASAAAP